MKVENGKPFKIKTANATAIVTVYNFSPKVVEKFYQIMVGPAIKRLEEKIA